MSFFSRLTRSEGGLPLTPAQKKKRLLRLTLFFVVLLLITGGVFAFKAGFILKKISLGHENLLTSFVKSLPGADNSLKGEKEGKINILLLGMRGADDPNGGLLADTIMLLSIHPSQGDNDPAKASLVSIPRDLYVTNPVTNAQSKINAVYFEGEKQQPNGGGIKAMENIIGQVTGMNIPYAIVLNFKGFTDLVNAVGGVNIHLDKPFEEGIQFRGTLARCDGITYTIPSGQDEVKQSRRRNGSIATRHFPLCFEKTSSVQAATLECGGDFKLPAGDNQLDGTKALCYARARYQSSDFERARRQQQVIQAIKDKALSIGTLTDFNKVNSVLDSLGDSVRTDLEVSEMKRLFDLYQKAPNMPLTQKVLEDSEEGLLYAPAETPETGYILKPRGDNFDQIHALFQSLP